MKAEFYEHAVGPVGFMAQGSEFGFGKMYARGINDESLQVGHDRFLHIVSCNTHNITTLVKTLCDEGAEGYNLDSAQFVCMRRANARQTRAAAQSFQQRLELLSFI